MDTQPQVPLDQRPEIFSKLKLLCNTILSELFLWEHLSYRPFFIPYFYWEMTGEFL